MSQVKAASWRAFIPQLIPVILSSGIIATGIGGIFYELVTKPNIQFEIISSVDDPRKVSIIISNHGGVPATKLKMLLIVPKKILQNNTFTIEDLTLKKINTTSLEVKMPRLAQGGGSVTQINLLIDAEPNTTYNNYSAYAVYDQGSSKFNLALTKTGFPNIPISLAIPLSLVIAGSIAMIFFFAYLRYFKKRKGKKFVTDRKVEYESKFGEYFTSPKDSYDLIQALIGLEQVRRNIDSVYNIKGYINRRIYDELNQEIDKRFNFLMHSHLKDQQSIESIKNILIDRLETELQETGKSEEVKSEEVKSEEIIVIIDVYMRIINFEIANMIKDNSKS